jgi:hypothetical protein
MNADGAVLVAFLVDGEGGLFAVLMKSLTRRRWPAGYLYTGRFSEWRGHGSRALRHGKADPLRLPISP